MNEDKRRIPPQYQNKVNNAQGHAFEDLIKRGCTTYLMRDRAIKALERENRERGEAKETEAAK